MRNYLSVFIALIIILTFTSCGLFVKKVSFTKEELEWFNIYNVKDVLIFKSLEHRKKIPALYCIKNGIYKLKTA